MRSLIVAGLLSITSAAPSAQAAATPAAAPTAEPSLAARLFRAPKPEAVGAIVGGVVAVQLAQRLPGRGRKDRDGRRGR